MQAENWSIRTFLERTDALAEQRGLSLRALAPAMGLSVASLFGYRNGSIPISRKAWSKLEQAERGALHEDEPPLPSVPDGTLGRTREGNELALLQRIALALERIAAAMEQAGPAELPMPGMKVFGTTMADNPPPCPPPQPVKYPPRPRQKPGGQT